jgi:dynein intermediate chain 1
MVVHF